MRIIESLLELFEIDLSALRTSEVANTPRENNTHAAVIVQARVVHSITVALRVPSIGPRRESCTEEEEQS